MLNKAKSVIKDFRDLPKLLQEAKETLTDRELKSMRHLRPVH